MRKRRLFIKWWIIKTKRSVTKVPYIHLIWSPSINFKQNLRRSHAFWHILYFFSIPITIKTNVLTIFATDSILLQTKTKKFANLNHNVPFYFTFNWQISPRYLSCWFWIACSLFPIKFLTLILTHFAIPSLSDFGICFNIRPSERPSGLSRTQSHIYMYTAELNLNISNTMDISM